MLDSKHKLKGDFKRTLCGTALSILMATSMLSTTVSADTLTVDYDSTVTDAVAKGYRDVTVELEKAETYTVTLPKSVVLDGTAESVSLPYTVTTNGEISSLHYVRVIPLSGAKLYNEDETAALDLDVSLSKRRWDKTEATSGSGSNETAGVFKVDTIEPGVWTGKVKFMITLDDGGDWTPATCTTPATCIGYDTNDNGVIDDDEKLTVPITKGQALGHKFATTAHAFPDTCERCKKPVYAISTPEQLTAFRDAVNAGTTFAGATVELNADIDMTTQSWDCGIGKDTNIFKGNFNGNNHTITNLNITTDGAVTCGFFTAINTDSLIQNIKLANCSVTYKYTGSNTSVTTRAGMLIGLVSECNLTISNVHIRNANVHANSNAVNFYGGVFCGEVDTSDKSVSAVNCSAVDSTVYGEGRRTVYIAGFTGKKSQNTLTVNNSLFDVACTVGSATYYATGCAFNAYWGDTAVITNSVLNVDATTPTAVIDPSNLARTVTMTNCLQTTVDNCKKQDALDVLNTDNNKVWVLDLENSNDGFPLIKQ